MAGISVYRIIYVCIHSSWKVDGTQSLHIGLRIRTLYIHLPFAIGKPSILILRYIIHTFILVYSHHRLRPSNTHEKTVGESLVSHTPFFTRSIRSGKAPSRVHWALHLIFKTREDQRCVASKYLRWADRNLGPQLFWGPFFVEVFFF